jgi:hypothetical protein
LLHEYTTTINPISNICNCNLNDNLYYENNIDAAIATQDGECFRMEKADLQRVVGIFLLLRFHNIFISCETKTLPTKNFPLMILFS